VGAEGISRFLRTTRESSNTRIGATVGEDRGEAKVQRNRPRSGLQAVCV
jgi:hypothetical protein